MKTPFERAVPEPNTGCWLWLSSMKPNGYGKVEIGGRQLQAHRWSYEFYRNPIPHGMVIDHLCRVRCCVNPAHMEVVTQKQNLDRSECASATNGRKTHCNRGHALADPNLITRTQRRYGATRECRTCTNANQRARRRACRS